MNPSEREPYAVFAGPYRYFLAWPTKLPNERILACIGANPSQAGRVENGVVLSDPTISRMRNLAHALGFGWLWMVNARSWISTNPKDMPPDPVGIGPDTDMWITCAANHGELVMCCYGHLGVDRGPRVLEIIRRYGKVPHALALTKDGVPRHPRGVPSSARPFPFGGLQ